MSLRAWWSRLRGTIRRDDTLEQEIEREMAFHLEMSRQRNVSRGMSAEDATRQAEEDAARIRADAVRRTNVGALQFFRGTPGTARAPVVASPRH